MNTNLTPGVAKDLGRSLRFLRHARERTTHDVALRSGLSIAYVQNIEGGARTNASEDAFEKLARGYDVPVEVMQDFVLRARILSALERRGLSKEQASFVWRGVEQRLSEQGIPVNTDLAAIAAGMLGNGHPPQR